MKRVLLVGNILLVFLLCLGSCAGEVETQGEMTADTVVNIDVQKIGKSIDITYGWCYNDKQETAKSGKKGE